MNARCVLITSWGGSCAKNVNGGSRTSTASKARTAPVPRNRQLPMAMRRAATAPPRVSPREVRAQVCPQHQRNRQLRRYHSLSCKGRHQQQGCNDRMHEPWECGTKKECGQEIGLQVEHDPREKRRVTQRRSRFPDHLQRDQHQRDTKDNTSALPPGPAGPAENKTPPITSSSGLSQCRLRKGSDGPQLRAGRVQFRCSDRDGGALESNERRSLGAGDADYI